MPRYVTRAKSPKGYTIGTDMGSVFAPHLEVDGPRETDTGLVDHYGNAVYRLQDPIGFLWWS